MAKKKAGGFNMAAEIRTLLEKDNSLSGRQVLEALKKKYPKQKFNANSLGVAFSNARKKLGLSKTVKRPKPTRRGGAGSSGGVNLDMLQAARQYVAKCGGDSDAAIAAVRQLAGLQL